MVGHQEVGQQPNRRCVKGVRHHPFERGIILRLAKEFSAPHASVDAVEHHAAGGLASGSCHSAMLTARSSRDKKRTCPASHGHLTRFAWLGEGPNRGTARSQHRHLLV